MFKQVKQVIKNCSFCIQCNKSSKLYKSVKAKHHSLNDFSVDLSFFNGWIMFHIMNLVTRMVFGVVCPTKKSSDVAKAMEECMNKFDVPI